MAVHFDRWWTAKSTINWLTNREGLYSTAEDRKYFELTEPEVDAFLVETWNKHISIHAHPECREYFMKYGSAPYTNYAQAGLTCIVCGTSKACGDQIRRHTFKELSMEECRKLGLYHGGSCYHVYQCTRCGENNSQDSSG